MSTDEILQLNKKNTKPRYIHGSLSKCSRFVRSIDPQVSDYEVRPSVHRPQEVLFHNAHFVVRDLRMAFTETRSRSIQALTPQVLQRSLVDLSVSYSVIELCLPEVMQRVTRKLDYLSREHSVSRRRSQDLLLDLTLRNCRLLSDAYVPSISVFESMGWRSVSIMIDRLAFVCYASDRAPNWLRDNVKKVLVTPDI